MNTIPEYRLEGDGTSIQGLPKVSLHDHLDGGLRPQTLIELADEIGLEVPATDAEALGDVVHRAVRTPVRSSSTSRRSTSRPRSCRPATGLQRVAREFVQDLAADGVIYGEIRWAPEQHLTRGLSLDEAVEAVQEGIEQGIEDVQHQGHATSAPASSSPRCATPIAASRSPSSPCGTATAGSSGSTSRAPRPASCRAGTARPSTSSPRSSSRSRCTPARPTGSTRIRSALFDGRALRLGHGVRIAEDLTIERQDDENTYVSLGPIAQWVRDREIALETSPSSNLQTGAIAAWGDELVDHPFDLLYQLGFRVTVNTDNRLQSGTSLTRELSLLSDAFGYDLDDFETFQLNAAASAFLPLDDREELAELIQDGFDEA